MDTMDNPLLIAYNKDMLKQESEFSLYFNWYEQRAKLVIKYAWAIPNDEAIAAIVNLGMPIVEIGAGTGYWASLLERMGVSIVCFDECPPAPRCLNHYKHEEIYFDVFRGSAEKVKEYSNCALMLCWAPYENPMAYDCLMNYAGNTLIWIGESQGGCTGDDAFFEELYKSSNGISCFFDEKETIVGSDVEIDRNLPLVSFAISASSSLIIA